MKEKSAKATLLFTITMILLLIQPAFAWPPPSEPHDADSMWIEPSSILLNATNPAHTVGYRFNITVYLNVTSDDVFMYQVALLYNRTQLKATRAAFTTPPTSEFMQGHPTTALLTIDTSFLGNGSILATEALSGTDKISPPRAASLIWVEFEVLIAPKEGKVLTSEFDISSTFPADTWVWNPFGSNILDVAYDGVYTFTSGVIPKHTLTITSTVGGTTDPSPGSYEYPEDTVVTVSALPDLGYLLDHWELDGSDAGSADSIDVTMDTNHTLHANFTLAPPPVGVRIFVDPDEIIDPELVPCTTFTINITVDEVVGMVTCEFNLTYNSDVLSWMGINLIIVQNQTPSASMNVNNDAGYIWVKLNYSGPISTSSPLALATITFHVEAFGSSILDLHDTELTDQIGQSIPHDVYDGFFMSAIRDVAIIDVVPSRSWAYAGWLVNITVTAKNLGNLSESFNVKAYYDSSLIGTSSVVDLAPGAETSLVFAWNTSGVAEGIYTLKGEATTVPYEYNTTNNIYIDDTVQILTTIHDVAIVDVVPARSWLYEDSSIDINVTAKNLGNVSESFDVKAYYDDNLIGTKPVVDLAAGAETTLTFIWNTSSVEPCHNYTLKGEATLVPYEYDTLNNVLVDGVVKVRISGDVNGDGKVDGQDLFYVAKAFGSFPGHPRWNAEADLNGDDRIDGRDIFIVSINFGRSCST